MAKRGYMMFAVGDGLATVDDSCQKINSGEGWFHNMLNHGYTRSIILVAHGRMSQQFLSYVTAACQ